MNKFISCYDRVFGKLLIINLAFVRFIKIKSDAEYMSAEIYTDRSDDCGMAFVEFSTREELDRFLKTFEDIDCDIEKEGKEAFFSFYDEEDSGGDV